MSEYIAQHTTRPSFRPLSLNSITMNTWLLPLQFANDNAGIHIEITTLDESVTRLCKCLMSVKYVHVPKITCRFDLRNSERIDSPAQRVIGEKRCFSFCHRPAELHSNNQPEEQSIYPFNWITMQGNRRKLWWSDQ